MTLKPYTAKVFFQATLNGSLPHHHLQELKAFHKVALTGGFTKASRELFVTQPAVSQQISALESSFRTTLFDLSSDYY